jgi:hypothetical protein
MSPKSQKLIERQPYRAELRERLAQLDESFGFARRDKEE